MCARIESLARKGIEVLNREVARKVWSWRLLSDSKDGQTVLEYASGAEHVVGKFYQDDSGRQNFRALEQLISSHCDTLRVPRPVFYDGQRIA